MMLLSKLAASSYLVEEGEEQDKMYHITLSLFTAFIDFVSA
jgi:hypothetical protein